MSEDNPERKNNEVIVDENLVDTLVRIYAERAKTDIEEKGGILEKSLRKGLKDIGISVEGTTLEEKKEDQIPEEIDTTNFEEELRKYFIENYSSLLHTGYNQFLADFSAQDYGEKRGDLIEIAMRCKIDPEKFRYFGYKLTIQDGLIAEEGSLGGIDKIYYATAEGINNRLSSLYSDIIEQKNKKNINKIRVDELEKTKYDYLKYAKENGIKIEDKDVFEEIPVDNEKVQTIAKNINKIINDSGKVETNDNIKLFAEEIASRYSEIMSYSDFSFSDLESVRRITGKRIFLIDGLHVSVEEICKDAKSLEELDKELTGLKEKEKAAKDLCGKYEKILDKEKGTKE